MKKTKPVLDFSASALILPVFIVISFKPAECAAILSAVVLHESAHILAAFLFGCRIERITAEACGLRITYSGLSSYSADILIAAAGPAMSIAAAYLFGAAANKLGSDILTFSAGINMALFIVNMLPASAFDGGRMLYGILNIFIPPGRADRWSCGTDMIMCCTMFAAGVAVLIIYGNPTLAICAVFICDYSCKSSAKSVISSI